MLTMLGLSPDVQAVPSFTWEGPWNVTLLPNCFGFNPNFCTPFGTRAFGAAATSRSQDGQILDTTADTAVARSEWAAVLGPDSGSTGLNFSRQFLLSDAPEGWSVSLNAILNGSVFAGGSNSAFVTAAASITPSLSLTFQDSSPSFATAPPFGHAVNQSQVQTTILSDGMYTVTGSLVTTAAGGSGISSSDFFGFISSNPAAGFQVSVTATALPEPSSILLLATGLAGAAWHCRKRGRSFF
jgi:hypothetical protein